MKLLAVGRLTIPEPASVRPVVADNCVPSSNGLMLTVEPALVLMMASPSASVPPPSTFNVNAPLSKTAPLVTVKVTPGLITSVLLPVTSNELMI